MLNFILGLIIGGGGVWVWVRRGMDSRLRGNDKVGNPNAEAMEAKRKNLEKVMAIVREKGEIANDDVQNALGISDATATRYLEELERQSKLEQIGSKKGVIYRAK